MSKLTPRQIKALETKERILNTALELFSAKGYDNVTIDDIAKASNTSKGAFYNHFHSKYEIFLEKFKEIDEFYIKFIDKLNKEKTVTRKLKKLIHAQLDYLENYLGKEVIRTIYINALYPNQDNFLSSSARPYYKIVKDLIEEGIKKGEFRDDISSDRATHFITRCTRGSLYDWCLYDDYNLVDEGTAYVSLFIEGLTNKNN